MARNRKKQRKKATVPQMSGSYRLPPVRHKEVRSALDMIASLNNRGNYPAAMELLGQIQQIEPDCPEIMFVLASTLEATGQVNEAITTYERLLQSQPKFMPGIVNLAALLAENRQFEAASKLYIKAISLQSDCMPAHLNLARVYMSLKRPAMALKHYDFIVKNRGTVNDLLEAGEAYDAAGNEKSSLKLYSRGLNLTGNKSLILTKMAIVELSRARKDEARRFLDQALQENSQNGFARYHLIKHFAKDIDLDGQLHEITSILEQIKDKSAREVRSPLHYARANILNRKKQYEQAFTDYRQANSLLGELSSDDYELRQANIDRLKQLFPAAAFKEQINSDQKGRTVFVLGPPRSGTTLIEQIIASHPEAAGVGELELLPNISPSLKSTEKAELDRFAASYLAGYPSRLAHKARIVDKSISSFQFIGLILAAFPDAILINSMRHPMDIAWSAYTEYFSRESLGFTYSFKQMARFLKQYDETLDYWRQELPGRILDVRYEQLVQSSEEQTRRLIEHTGLEWNDQCLNFHQNTSTVRTASIDQVRQPIYSSSISRWKPYEPWLDELKELLKEAVCRYEAI